MIKGPNLPTIRKRLENPPQAILNQLPALQECITTRWIPYSEKGSNAVDVPACQLCDVGCPTCVITAVTGQEGCIGTPFIDWINIPYTDVVAEQECAHEELAFLRRVETVLIELTEEANNATTLNDYQLAVVKAYNNGDWAHITSLKEAENLGDTLFLFLLRELDDVTTNSDAVRRMETARNDVITALAAVVANTLNDSVELPKIHHTVILAYPLEMTDGSLQTYQAYSTETSVDAAIEDARNQAACENCVEEGHAHRFKVLAVMRGNLKNYAPL